MSKLLTILFLFAAQYTHAQSTPSFIDNAKARVNTIIEQGNWDLYVPLYTYHMPYAYTPEKISQYTHIPLGIGLGKGYYNKNNNWEGIYGMTFKDSHGIYQYMAGYAWIPSWKLSNNGNWKVGAGATVFLMSRQDINNYIPFPGLLPVGSISYKKASLQTAFVPGGDGFGNVLFTWAKWSFN
jgi:palmitoyl transferase